MELHILSGGSTVTVVAFNYLQLKIEIVREIIFKGSNLYNYKSQIIYFLTKSLSSFHSYCADFLFSLFITQMIDLSKFFLNNIIIISFLYQFVNGRVHYIPVDLHQ